MEYVDSASERAMLIYFVNIADIISTFWIEIQMVHTVDK